MASEMASTSAVERSTETGSKNVPRVVALAPVCVEGRDNDERQCWTGAHGRIIKTVVRAAAPAGGGGGRALRVAGREGEEQPAAPAESRELLWRLQRSKDGTFQRAGGTDVDESFDC